MSKINFNAYIHQFGKELLEMKLRENREMKSDKINLKDARTKNARLLRKKIKVVEMDDGGLSVSLDQDWDTSNWTTEMIEAGCEALVLLFFNPENPISDEKKERAILMIEKLLYRHPQAEDYFRRGMESMVGKTVNRLLRNGKSACLLDLLYVLSSCRERFSDELSKYNFNGRFHEMLLLESRLAATLIQHTFRAYKKRKTIHIMHENPYTKVFGTDLEMKMLRVGYVTAKGFELRMRWRIMHWDKHNTEWPVVGMRGPIHVPQKYVLLGMNVILSLVSEKGGEYASANREDVVRSNGCILLALFIASPSGPFAQQAALILNHVTKSSESFATCLHSGCVRACMLYIRHLRGVMEVLDKKARKKVSQKLVKDYQAHMAQEMAEKKLRESYISSINAIMRLATHAAGLFRARRGYLYKRKGTADAESIDYRTVLQRAGSSVDEDFVLTVLAHPAVMTELMAAMLSTMHIETLEATLGASFALSCSDCFSRILAELMAKGSRGLVRVLELLEEGIITISTLSMCLLVQLCVFSAGRKALLDADIAKYLRPLCVSEADGYERLPYLRGLLIMAALCRQEQWRSYDPEQMPQYFASGGPEVLRVAIFTDLMRTMKKPPLEVADSLPLVDLAILPMNEEATLSMSKQANELNARALVDFICRPHQHAYFTTLAWDESLAACVLLYGLSKHPPAAANMFSSGLTRFLSHCMYVGKYLFFGAPMSDSKIMVVLNTITAAANTLCNLSLACIGRHENARELIECFNEADVTGCAVYFINTLSTTHPSLDKGTRAVQVSVGLAVVRLIDGYAQLLLSFGGEESEKLLLELSPAGEAVSYVLKSLYNVFGKSSKVLEMLDTLCSMLSRLTVTQAGAEMATSSWDTLRALKVHMPFNVSGIPSQSPMDEVYKKGLGGLPASFFHICANLCQMDAGTRAMFSDGFLRRAMEKLMIVFPHVETNADILAWKDLKRRNQPVPEPSRARKECGACLRLIAKVANYVAPKLGASNDLILSPMYTIVEICGRVLGVEENWPEDELVAEAIAVLCALSKDPVASTDDYEAADVLSRARSQLLKHEDLSASARRNLVDMCKNVAQGVRSQYVVNKLPTLREALTRVGRLYHDTMHLVNDTQWEISKAVKSLQLIREYERTHRDEDDDAEVAAAASTWQQRIQTPNMTSRDGAAPGATLHTSNMHNSFSSPIKFSSDRFLSNGDDDFDGEDADRQFFRTPYSPIQFGLQTNAFPSRPPSTAGYPSGGGAEAHGPRPWTDSLVASKLFDSEAGTNRGQKFSGTAPRPLEGAVVQAQHPTGSRGVVTAANGAEDEHTHGSRCTISNCGSLRFPDTPTSHGTYNGVSDRDLSLRMMELPMVNDSGVLALTREEAVAGRFCDDLKEKRNMAIFGDVRYAMMKEGKANTRPSSQHTNGGGGGNGLGQSMELPRHATTAGLLPQLGVTKEPVLNTSKTRQGPRSGQGDRHGEGTEKLSRSGSRSGKKPKAKMSASHDSIPKILTINVQDLPELAMTRPALVLGATGGSRNSAELAKAVRFG